MLNAFTTRLPCTVSCSSAVSTPSVPCNLRASARMRFERRTIGSTEAGKTTMPISASSQSW